MTTAGAGATNKALHGPDLLQALLSRIAKGDEEAFADLYSLTAARLLGLALKVVRRPELAEEIVQEVYLQVWSSAGGCDPSRGTPLAWLFTLTHRRAVDVVRREQSCLERDSRYHRRVTMSGQDSTEELVLRRLKDEKVLAGLAKISGAQSKTIALAYFGGQTCAEVARTLNLSVPAVKSRLRDGLGNLRQLLGPAADN